MISPGPRWDSVFSHPRGGSSATRVSLLERPFAVFQHREIQEAESISWARAAHTTRRKYANIKRLSSR
jgi:hypothetical protein